MARSSTTWKKGQSPYTDAEKRAALELAAAIGTKPAARRLGITPHSIRNWREQFPEMWSDLRSDAPKRKTRAAENLEDLEEGYSALEFEAMDRAEKLIKTADAKELAALIKAMGSSRGLASVGARSYRGDDVQRIEHTIDFPALEAAAQAILRRAEDRPALEVTNLAEERSANVDGS